MSQERAEAGDAGPGELKAQLPAGLCLLRLTFHCQLHCHLAGATTIAGFTGVLSLVLLMDTKNHKAESPSDIAV